jgi:hypothetical protein
MDREDLIRNAWSDFNAATAQLAKCVPGKQGMSHNIRYGQAYQRLVILGEVPQLRLKYRG